VPSATLSRQTTARTARQASSLIPRRVRVAREVGGRGRARGGRRTRRDHVGRMATLLFGFHHPPSGAAESEG
jgi:hypothetical protein